MDSDNMQDLIKRFDGMSQDARLWIFQSDQALSGDEVNFIQTHLDNFLPHWTSHNRQLSARAAVAMDHFIIIALDESQSSMASGCSIDTMTRKIQEIANSLSSNLLDRSIFYFLIDGEVKGYSMNQVKNAKERGLINENSPVFNNLIKTKAELSTSWVIPARDSWHKRFF